MPGDLMSRRPFKIKCTYDTLEYPSKGLNLPRLGIFGLPLTQSVKILQKSNPGTSHIMHHTSHSTHHTAHFTYEFEVLYEIKDIDGGAI